MALPGGTRSHHEGTQRKIANLSVSLCAFSALSVFLFFTLRIVPAGTVSPLLDMPDAAAMQA
jgi:hypothetical protein